MPSGDARISNLVFADDGTVRPVLDWGPGEDALVARWEDAVGHRVRDLDRYLVPAGVRFATAMPRVAIRAKAEGQVPEDSDVERKHSARGCSRRCSAAPRARSQR